MNEKLLFLLRLIRNGQQTVYEDADGNYYSERQEDKETHIKSVKGRLMLELYGEYPLSSVNKADFDNNINPLFYKGKSVYS